MTSPSFSRRAFLKTSALALPLLVEGCASFGSSATETDEFVRVRQGRFELRGRPYFYIGTNLWYGCYLSDAALPEGRARLVRELDRLQALGITNIRLLGGSETSKLAGAIARGITISPGKWDEALLVGLDFCLAEMARRDQRAIVFLSNYWQWSGGFAQYVNWATGEAIPDPDRPTIAAGDWHAFMKMSARLYQNARANGFYRDYISRLIHRKNTVNGRLYRDDPAIMTWELANEPRPGTDDDATLKDVPAFCAWVEGTARFIHEQDPHHLVCTGSEGIVGCLKRPEVFIEAHRTSAIDYVTVHMWLKNWGWLKNPMLSAEFEEAAIRAREHVEKHNEIATGTLRKPLVLEEFGLPRDHEKLDPSSPTLARDEYYKRMFAQVAESCQAGRALQAANFWAWGGEGRVNPGKLNTAGAFTGDPFCEPQGLNSVFDSDASTLAVIREANERLKRVPG
jgi:mannan endo-1,4-beta-mannosidase